MGKNSIIIIPDAMMQSNIIINASCKNINVCEKVSIQHHHQLPRVKKIRYIEYGKLLCSRRKLDVMVFSSMWASERERESDAMTF